MYHVRVVGIPCELHTVVEFRLGCFMLTLSCSANMELETLGMNVFVWWFTHYQLAY